MAIINGDDNPNVINGTVANDIINGLGGDDVLDGGIGQDQLFGGQGDDVLYAGRSDQTFDGGDGVDTVTFSHLPWGGTATLVTGSARMGNPYANLYDLIGIENLTGTNFNDELTGNSGANVLRGEGGNDLLRGGAGADSLIGGGGVDTATYSESASGVTVDLAAGTGMGGDAGGDTLAGIENVTGSKAGGDTLTGDSGSNVLGGLAGDDLLRGGAGNDTLEGGAGIDTLDGGDGVDTVSYLDDPYGAIVDLTLGIGAGSDNQPDTLIGIENVIGTIYGGDVLTGNNGSNVLSGRGGNDLLRGGGGADTLDGGHGGPWGPGTGIIETDIVAYYSSATAVTVDLAAGTAAGGDAQGDILIDIEAVTGSNVGGDVLTGTSGANSLWGYGGDDLLRGGNGADKLDGGTGVDTATYYASALGVTVGPGSGSGGDAQGDKLDGIENLTGSNIGGDSLTGTDGANVLRGWGGDDQLFGGAGADTLDGGVGSDTASYFGNGGAVTVNLAAGTASGGTAQGDVLISIESVDGSNFNDTLTGSGANNTMRGWTGRDMLTGGAGADRFIYAATSESAVGANADRITDFSHAQGDRIDLSTIDANGGAPGNGVFTFIGTGLFTGVPGQLRFAVTSPGVTTIAGDVNGDGTSDFHIQLTGNLALVAGDFVL
ncbi:Ca2+-binding RTX toxin-like protein [Inquilinus ginsengisoli]|uniref:beta strand repeat-containing protein n=1 Tax=Inquilinus ginsengisoli TaxID=363840 RepID=UPI003D24866C